MEEGLTVVVEGPSTARAYLHIRSVGAESHVLSQQPIGLGAQSHSCRSKEEETHHIVVVIIIGRTRSSIVVCMPSAVSIRQFRILAFE